MDNFTFAVVNDVKKSRFPLEKFLRTLGMTPGGYVMGMLDCCRERISDAMRGSGAANSEVLDEVENYRNVVLSFGCPPNSGVDARSTIAIDYFAKLKQIANPYDGSVILPGRFLTWSPGNGGEHVPLYTEELRLVHSDWVPKGPAPAGHGGPTQALTMNSNAQSSSQQPVLGSLAKDLPVDRSELKQTTVQRMRALYDRAIEPNVMFKLGLKNIPDDELPAGVSRK